MRPWKPYRGVLRRRMPAPGKEAMDKCLMAWHERLVALAAHYELDWRAPDFGLSLALALAEDHVEGFKIAKDPGAPVDPGQVALDITLFWEVLGARKKGQTDASAYRRIVKRRRARGLHGTEAALRKRFYDLVPRPRRTDGRLTLKPAGWRMWRMLAMLVAPPDKKKL